MNLRARYRSWRRRRRLNKAAGGQKAPLREFVYLDDVSVYSLYASRMGAIATDVTETQAASLRSEVRGAAGINALAAKAEVGSRLQTEDTQGTQVLRKSIIQTTFKELYDLERESLVMRPIGHDVEPESRESIRDLDNAAKSGRYGLSIIDPVVLRRGALVELEVQLETEPIFHAGAVISGVLDIFHDNPAMFGVQATALADASAINRMLGNLLGGLIPVRGRVIDYAVAEVDGKQWVVHRDVLARLDVTIERRSRPLFLTGVAEHALFWKDIRRVLFAGSSYRVLARLAGDGVQSTWTPVKLVDVLRTVAPQVADSIMGANRGFLTAMVNTPPDYDAGRLQMLRDALVAYGVGLSEAMGGAIDVDEFSRSDAVANLTPESLGSVLGRRQVFGVATRFVEAKLGATADRTTAADCRTAALIDAGLTLDGQVPVQSPTPMAGSATDVEERFLDSELIAIYW
jgi:hypothetical protein